MPGRTEGAWSTLAARSTTPRLYSVRTLYTLYHLFRIYAWMYQFCSHFSFLLVLQDPTDLVPRWPHLLVCSRCLEEHFQYEDNK